jgi:endonuclease/exonuclease/phosphatase family metal-dependent hydrolase
MTIVLISALVIIAAWAATRSLPAGLDGHKPFPYLIALLRWLWMPALLIAIIAGVSHHWLIMALALALAADLAYLASPTYRNEQSRDFAHPDSTYAARLNMASEPALHGPLADRNQTDQSESTDAVPSRQQADPGHEGLNIMTLNCKYGHADAEAIVRTVNEQGTDVLALQEMSAGLAQSLEQAGLADVLPYSQFGVGKETDNGGFNGLYSSIKPVRQATSALELPAADVPSITVETLEGRTVTLYSAHPKSPMRGCREWSQGIRSLGALAHRHESAEAVIMGDFNSNIDHPSFRALLHSGFSDAGLAASHRNVASFCTWLKWPRMELDHVLTTSGLNAYGARTVFIPGTDHFGLTARVHESDRTQRR